jgi:hypothetical protein
MTENMLTVTVDGTNTIEVEPVGNPNTAAWDILKNGLRVFNQETRRATFYPPHRITLVQAVLPETKPAARTPDSL